MKNLLPKARCSLIVLFGLILGVADARAQETCSGAAGGSINVDMWRLPDANVFPDGIRTQFVNLSSEVLRRLNTSGNSSPDSRFGPGVNDKINALNDDYCARRGHTTGRPYKILAIPMLGNHTKYQVRGLHLLSKTDGNAKRPQLVIEFQIDGGRVSVSDVMVNDINTRVQQEFQGDKAEKAYELVKRLGEAYVGGGNGPAAIIDSLEAALLGSFLGSNEVNVKESPYPNDDPERGVTRKGQEYINLINGRLGRLGETEITYENIEVYPHPSDGNIIRVTVLQHYMHKNTGSYMDTDYLAIDVVFDGNDNAAIELRLAGRGTFGLDSEPTGVEVTEINGKKWPESAPIVTTPIDSVINAPLQFHKIRLQNRWYDDRVVTFTPTEISQRKDSLVELTHKEAALEFVVTPEDKAPLLNYSLNGQNEGTILHAEEVTLDETKLMGQPPTGARAVDYPTRHVDLRVTLPGLNDYVVKESRLVWDQPNLKTVPILFPKGELIVDSNPSAAAVSIDGVVHSQPTTLQDSVYVTVDTPMQVQVSKDECIQEDPEVDECLLHVPSRLRDVTVAPGQTTNEMFYLAPFKVRDQTNAGDIEATLTREGDQVTVSYQITDNRDRNRKYLVDFDLFDNSGNKVGNGDLDAEVKSCTAPEASNNACTGKNLRPGSYSFTWDLAAHGLETDTDPHSLMPVLSLRRKSTCWPCVLIPAAAGVVGAYIWPRTGSNEAPEGFIPPPRPGETLNR